MEDLAAENIDTNRYKVPVLTADNYYIWSHKMELLLRGRRLWDIADGSEQEPEESSAHARYIRRRDIALTNIVFSIDDRCNAAVITLREPHAVWKKLSTMYEKVLEARFDALMSLLQKTKMRSDERMMGYVNCITELENKLAGVGHMIEETEKKRVLLRGLLEEFHVTAEVIRATELSFDGAFSRLVTTEVEREMNDQEIEDNGSSALTTSHGHKRGRSTLVAELLAWYCLGGRALGRT